MTMPATVDDLPRIRHIPVDRKVLESAFTLDDDGYIAFTCVMDPGAEDVNLEAVGGKLFLRCREDVEKRIPATCMIDGPDWNIMNLRFCPDD